MWVALLAVLIGSGLIVYIGLRGLMEKLPRQRWAGIRTPYSMANDEQWKAVHRYGSPYLIFGGVAAFATCLAIFPFALAGKLPDAFAVVVVLVAALLLGASALLAWVLGVRGAKASLAR